MEAVFPTLKKQTYNNFTQERSKTWTWFRWNV